MKRAAVLFFTVILALAAAAALAAGDAAKGQELAKTCACHKSKGDLDGKPAADLVAKMQAYKAGQGDNKPMIAMMQKRSDQDIEDLAAYYAGLPKK